MPSSMLGGLTGRLKGGLRGGLGKLKGGVQGLKGGLKGGGLWGGNSTSWTAERARRGDKLFKPYLFLYTRHTGVQRCKQPISRNVLPGNWNRHKWQLGKLSSEQLWTQQARFGAHAPGE